MVALRQVLRHERDGEMLALRKALAEERRAHARTKKEYGSLLSFTYRHETSVSARKSIRYPGNDSFGGGRDQGARDLAER